MAVLPSPICFDLSLSFVSVPILLKFDYTPAASPQYRPHLEGILAFTGSPSVLLTTGPLHSLPIDKSKTSDFSCCSQTGPLYFPGRPVNCIVVFMFLGPLVRNPTASSSSSCTDGLPSRSCEDWFVSTNLYFGVCGDTLSSGFVINVRWFLALAILFYFYVVIWKD